jgi:hypothetical protein
MGPLSEEGVGGDDDSQSIFDTDPGFGNADEWVDWQQMKQQMKHDEL